VTPFICENRVAHSCIGPSGPPGPYTFKAAASAVVQPAEQNKSDRRQTIKVLFKKFGFTLSPPLLSGDLFQVIYKPSVLNCGFLHKNIAVNRIYAGRRRF
jgi:hypothetical protein